MRPGRVRPGYVFPVLRRRWRSQEASMRPGRVRPGYEQCMDILSQDS